MRVLVTGAAGRLGREVVAAFGDHDVVALDHHRLDVTDEAAVVATLAEVVPALVVHTAAFTDVDGCERDPDRAHRVNALGAWWVARACALVDAQLLHVSTDQVFGGEPPVGQAYTEFDPPAPVNAYGRSKLAGETLVRQTLDRHYVVRAAWLHGAHGDDFVARILRQARGGAPLRVVDDRHGNPTYSRDLAGALRAVAVTGRHGTYHRTNAGSCSRHELATAALGLAGIDRDVEPIASDTLGNAAERPVTAVLDDRHTRLSGLAPLPHWRDALARSLADRGRVEAADTSHDEEA